MTTSTATIHRRQADRPAANRASEAYGTMTLQAIIDQADK